MATQKIFSFSYHTQEVGLVTKEVTVGKTLSFKTYHGSTLVARVSINAKYLASYMALSKAEKSMVHSDPRSWVLYSL